jgi:hypothetical protein
MTFNAEALAKETTDIKLTGRVNKAHQSMKAVEDKRARLHAEADTKIRPEWVDCTLELCKTLAIGREKFAGNKQFNRWLKQTSLHDINRNTRAALIAMGENYDLTAKILPKSASWSPQLIWEYEIKPQRTTVCVPSGDDSGKTDPQPDTAPEDIGVGVDHSAIEVESPPMTPDEPLPPDWREDDNVPDALRDDGLSVMVLSPTSANPKWGWEIWKGDELLMSDEAPTRDEAMRDAETAARQKLAEIQAKPETPVAEVKAPEPSSLDIPDYLRRTPAPSEPITIRPEPTEACGPTFTGPDMTRARRDDLVASAQALVAKVNLERANGLFLSGVPDPIAVVNAINEWLQSLNRPAHADGDDDQLRLWIQ